MAQILEDCESFFRVGQATGREWESGSREEQSIEVAFRGEWESRAETDLIAIR